MSVYSDKVVKELKRHEIAAINTWRKTFCRSFEASDVSTLKALSEAADQLWQRHLDACVRLRTQTTDELPVWPDPPSEKPSTSTQWKDEQWAKTIRHPYSPYRRLKLAMDYWCALWFWPIEQSDLLPTRDQFLMEMSVLLGVTPTVPDAPAQIEFTSLLVDIAGTPQQVQPDLDLDDPAGLINVEELCRKLPRLNLVHLLADKRRFFHWELEFVDVFARRGGFDLIAGNPPWIKIEWNEGGLLSERNPAFAIRKLSASEIAKLREGELSKNGVLADYLSEYEEFEGTQNFLTALQNYPLLKGQQTNLYKCFITRAWELNSTSGVTGLLHPEGVYDDPKAGPLRRVLYPRLRSHLQFWNEKKLFAEVHHETLFSVNIYHSSLPNIAFESLANLFSPSTADASFEHSGMGPIPGIKNDDGNWEIAGHRERVVRVDADTLGLFAQLYDEAGTDSAGARFPALHSSQLVHVLRKFAAYPHRLSDLGDDYIAMEMWHETNAQKDGTIRRTTTFPKNTGELILSGPHFHVARPLYKTPRAICETNGAYDLLDLETLPDDYLPRTNYLPACTPTEYCRRTPLVPWDDRRPVTEFPRLTYRGMLSQSGERTLIGAIIPPKSAHINGALSVTFRNVLDLISATAMSASVISDFFIKTTGSANLHFKWTCLPKIPPLPAIAVRALILNCLTSHYADLWTVCWNEDFINQFWLGDDPRLDQTFWHNLTPAWSRDCALRTDFTRRWALVEIDVLAAKALNLTLEELQTVYRIQFPVLRQNEVDTWYDQRGRIVFTCSKGLPGVGFDRAEWNTIRDLTSGTVTRKVVDNTLPTGPIERTIVYHAPFTRCDREHDYATVWAKLDALKS